jgi:3-hydroxyacyl-CoA dehydrogenase / enoyl-CoA hydratase / 3-hydroxybutyryl-CoA epimerase
MNATVAEATTHVEQSGPPEVTPSVLLETDEDGIALVRFDRLGSSVNVFDTATLGHLAAIVNDLGRGSPRGVIFMSSKPAVFIAGADLRELAGTQDRAGLVELGQQIFTRIGALRCVTIAAIHGACAGGGFEMSLACDYRVASDAHVTKIGLPEINLGLIPAWGGSTRLPRLIGLPRALKVILGGDLMPSSKARELGLVDAIAPRERLTFLAKRFVDSGKPRRFSRHLAWIPAWQAVAAVARKSVLKKTREHYPAALRAIDVVTKAVVRSIPQSLVAEKKAILALADGDVSSNLIRIFFLQDRAKHLPSPKAASIEKTAVIGSGIMGAGIAQWFAARGKGVLLSDVGPEQLAQGLQRAEKLFAEARRRRILSRSEARAGMDRIVPAESAVPMKSIDLVVEAASENMQVKKAIFADLEERVRSDTILATNTSALSVTEISRGLRDPARVVGLHFFNPVHRMKLVEIARGELTSDFAADTAVAFVQRIGKLPVVVKDRPGFLVNRILLPYLLEAVRLFVAGAHVEALDESMLDFGMPMGPLRLLDEVGLDVAADVGETLCRAFPDRMHTPGVFAQLLAANIKGKKTERGFYEYQNGRVAGVNRFATDLREADDKASLTRDQLQERMVFLMINEAARCLEERVVEDPRDVDFAMIMGTGFAPFRGGPLRYADSVGIAKVTEILERLTRTRERQFAPCDLLIEMTRQQKKFYGTESSPVSKG